MRTQISLNVLLFLWSIFSSVGSFAGSPNIQVITLGENIFEDLEPKSHEDLAKVLHEKIELIDERIVSTSKISEILTYETLLEITFDDLLAIKKMYDKDLSLKFILGQDARKEILQFVVSIYEKSSGKETGELLF